MLFRVLCWAYLAAFVLPSAALPEKASEIIDPSTGNIDGKKALGIWASGTIGGDVELFGSAGFSVHLVPHDDLDRELVFPYGEWFSPPAGGYQVLVEGPNLVSPTAMTIRYGASPFAGQGMAIVHLAVPAGKVRVRTDNLPANTVARVMHLESHRQQHPEYQRNMLVRRASLAAIGEGVLMPTGRLIVVLYDQISEEYVATSQPVHVEEGKTVLAEPFSPAADKSGLLAVVKRPSPVPRKQDDDAEVRWMDSADRSVAPDLLIRSSSRLVAVWYGLSGSGRVVADSPTIARQEMGVGLVPGKVHRLDLYP